MSGTCRFRFGGGVFENGVARAYLGYGTEGMDGMETETETMPTPMRALFEKGDRVKLVSVPDRDEDDEGPPPTVGAEFTVAVDQVAMDMYPYIDVRNADGEGASFLPRELTLVPRRLEVWSLVTEKPFGVPHGRRCYVSGAAYGVGGRPDGREVVTSHIVGSKGREVYTASGSTYLLGEPSEGYRQWLRDNEPDWDPEDPLASCDQCKQQYAAPHI